MPPEAQDAAGRGSAVEALEAIMRIKAALVNEAERQLVDAGLPKLSAVIALGIVHRHKGTARIQELCGSLSMTTGAASKLVAKMERDGLLRRSPHPHDGRAVTLALTGDGDRARAASESILAEVLERSSVNVGNLEQILSAVSQFEGSPPAAATPKARQYGPKDERRA